MGSRWIRIVLSHVIVCLGLIAVASFFGGPNARQLAAAPTPDSLAFIAHTIDTDLKGGYQVVVADLNRDGKPDIIALAGDLDELRWYENPSWQKHVLIKGVRDPINVAAFDVDGDGIPEIALAHEFSDVYAESAGKVSILTHNGDPTGAWAIKDIDRLPTSHRLRFVDIEGNGRKVLVNFPLIGPTSVAPEYRGRLPLVMYRPGTWKREVITDEDEGVVHGIAATSWDGSRRESLLSASFRGVHLLQFIAGRWNRSLLVKGDPSAWPKSGASEVVLGHLGRERFLATIEPWHGNQVVVYRQSGGHWNRHVVDEMIRDGHTLVSGDFDGDGKDELVVGERGGKRSTYLYRFRGSQQDSWERQVIDNGGMAAAGCAVADLNGDRRPDVICIGTATANLKWYENHR